MKGEWIRKPAKGVAVIFVHGVLSSGETCWKNSNGAYWPTLLRDEPAATDLGIWVFTYNTNIFSGKYSIDDAVDALKEHMQVDGLFNCHTLVFVCHSMGGLVVRKLLVSRVTQFMERKISVGLFLVASPSLGSRYADLLKPLAKLFNHTQADALRFSENNPWLAALDKEFMNFKEKPNIPLFGKELVESVFIVKIPLQTVVETFSGFRYFGEPYKVPESNHFSIAKPESSEAIQHRLLLKFIAETRLPIEAELWGRLKARFDACREAGLAFRTAHKLGALLAMDSGFSMQCFDTRKAGTGALIQKWLQNAILSQPAGDRDSGPSIQLEDDEAIVQARAMARAEHAEIVDERHLLVTLLSDLNLGAIREIRRQLEDKGFEEVIHAAKTGNPARARRRVSNVSPLDLGML